MPLVIVESPTKSKTISSFLGPQYQVLSSYGHIRDLPKGKLGIDIEKNFAPQYVVPTKSKKTITELKKQAQKADKIILSTDEDREGEAIAFHLAFLLGLDKNEKYERIVFHEITKQAIEKALQNPRKINITLVNAQQARRILDRIVGYKLSPFLWKKVARGLSAGRVQSVAVRLVVEREREIESFVPQEYWTITAQLKKMWGGDPPTILPGIPCQLEAILVKKNGEVIPKLGIKMKKEAEKIVKDLESAQYKVANVEKKETKKNPLPPFTTSTLQQTAWQRFKWPAKQTMRIAQQLYETGKITYHRTDSLNLSDMSLFAAKKFIVENYGKNYWAGFLRKYKTKSKGAQEAHEAIRPTFPNKTPDKLNLEGQQAKLYQLIWQRFIACQMNQASFNSTIVEIEANSKSQTPNSKQIQNSKIKIQNQYTFRTTGQVLKFDGFLKVYPMKYEEADLPALKENEFLELIKLISSQHFTQPPPRYNEASLIKTLEENGIGRPSTYAPILSNIQEKNYIEKDEQKRFRPTEIGIVVNNMLAEHFPEIVDLKFTAKMEENLDQIAEGKKQWTKVIEDFYNPFEENLQQKYEQVSKKDITEKPTEKLCPKCKSPLLIRIGKYGKFYACSAFPKCRYTESLEENNFKIKCPKCKKGNIVEKRTKKRKIFYGCDQYPKCDFALWDKPVRQAQGESTGKKCPKCNSLLVETKNKKIKCSQKECDYSVEK